MSRLIKRFLQFRALEIAIFCGFCLTGLLWYAPLLKPLSAATISLFLAGLFALYFHAFFVNDWAEGRYKPLGSRRLCFVVALVSMVISVLLLLSSSVATLPYGAAILLLSTAYSHPLTHVKTIPVLNSLFHLLAGSCQFLLGASLVKPLTSEMALLAIYFGMLLSAGHLHQEVQHYDEDSHHGDSTNAVFFGKAAVSRASLCLFILATAFLWLLTTLAILPQGIAVFHTLTTLVQILLWWQWQRRPRFASLYRGSYRIIFSLLIFYWYYSALKSQHPRLF